MKAQKENRFKILGRLCLLAALFFVEAVLLQQTSLIVNAQGTTTVTASGGKIRESASIDSDVMASVTKNDKLDVLAQTTDSNGYTWYKVYVNGTDTGYIRADLVGEVSGSISTESASSTSNDTSDDGGDEPAQQQTEYVQVNATEAAAGIVNSASVNVRENPSTNASITGQAASGTEVTISGEATDSSGKIWYQVSFGDVTGFIRSDFLEITQTVEAEEEPVEEVEEPVEEVLEESVNKDYELVYEANAEGIEEWFLYDHTRGTKQSLADLLAVVRQNQDNQQSAVSQVKTLKILAIVMAALILALIIVVTVLIFKLRDSYEYEYEDDDDEDDDDEDEDDEDDEDEEDEEDIEEEDDDEDDEIVRKPLFRKASQSAKSESRSFRTKQEERPQANTPKSELKAEPEKKDTGWQSKNFLDIDDDMEFEFLDLK